MEIVNVLQAMSCLNFRSGLDNQKVVFSGDLTHLGTFWKTDIQTDNTAHILGTHTPINHMTLYLYGADVASFHNRV